MNMICRDILKRFAYNEWQPIIPMPRLQKT